MINNKKGFTLIELIAVIVILGILAVIAIPAINRYIETSKKETLIASLNSAAVSVKYDVASGGNNSSFEIGSYKYYYLSDIQTEKGKITSPFGEMVYAASYIVAYKQDEDESYNYDIQFRDNAKYCIELTSVDNLDVDTVQHYLGSSMYLPCNAGVKYKSYRYGEIVNFSGSDWYVAQPDTDSMTKIVMIKKDPLTNAELGDYAFDSTANQMSYYWGDDCHQDLYGYNDYYYSKCSSHYSYDGSKIKEFLEDVYLKTLKQDAVISIRLLNSRNYVDLIPTEDRKKNIWGTGSYGAMLYNKENGNPTYPCDIGYIYPVIEVYKNKIKD